MHRLDTWLYVEHGAPKRICDGGGDFAPPVVLLDHQGIEKALDLENESSLLILFEAWNPAALNEYRAWTSSGTFDALGEIKAYWTSYGALREIGERAFDGSIPSTLYDPYLVLSKRYQVDRGARTYFIKRGKVVGAFQWSALGSGAITFKCLKA